ncbi:signal peptidase II [Wenjunlia vitaminophila]|uniref:Lipoprotein signal peptidase n=1 Tax=Wenjunlia vitaminophila TaxID=76728 RepID=A0A0T6LWP7_WENVI|nr:signal peptidase II [Wenjunlia vitaminophila]KRV50140.1 signal peptidase II [Wenjunlia vitaminophila]
MAKAERTIGTPDCDDDGPDDGGDARDSPRRPDEQPQDEPAPQSAAPRGHRRIVALLAVALVAYALDLGTKLVVVEKLEGRPAIEVIGTYLRFDVVRNPGAAFGLGEALTIVLTVIAASVIVIIARIARKLYSLPWAIALGLLLGGALGNLTDRVFRSPGVFRGEVVDFIAPANFAVFNLADSAIVCGGFLIVLLSFRGSSPDGTVHRD